MNRTLDQRRAMHAWEAVQAVAEANAPRNPAGARVPNDAAKKFGVHVRKMPIRIMASGLGQALAFLVAKGNAGSLLQAIAGWVLHDRQGATGPANLRDDALLMAVVRGDSETLQLYTVEALAYLQWLGRFAQAEGLTGTEDE